MNTIEEVLTALRRVIRATDLHSKHLEKTAGMTAPQLLLLQILRDASGKVTIGDLARQMHLSQATVTTIMDRLESRELVQRRRSNTDKRKVYATLTTAGGKALHNAPAPLQHYFVQQFQNLQNWEQGMIIASLQRVAQMMDAQHLDASPVLDVGPLDRDPQAQAAPAARRKIKPK
jgi:DNA-binding MarR family transcriptional regulator